MDKDDYVELHTLLAKLRFELEIAMLEATEEYMVELQKEIEAVNKVMQIFIVEG